MARPHPLASLRRPDNLVKIAGVGSSSSCGRSSNSWRSGTPSSFVVPELAHLSTNTSKRASGTLRPGEATRIHAHKHSHSTSSVPDPPAKNPTRERRYAKTPIRSIEQHEFDDVPARDPRALSKMTSTDLIAESYRMLIEADRSLLCTPKPSMHFLPFRQNARDMGDDKLHTTVFVTSPGSETEDDSYGDPTTPRADHFAAGFGGDIRRSLRQADSPLSDAGTLVGPDESAAAIYFKPSFSPGLAPVLDDFVQLTEPAPSPTLSIDRNPGLSICLDLLSQELLSASAGTPMRPGSETSALQVQAMIEAYENLRDQALYMGLGVDQALAARDMFDTWIQALRSVQAMISIRDLPVRSTERRRPQQTAVLMA